jgi:PAS domain S-box-containing protein
MGESTRTKKQLLVEMENLRTRLEEAEEALGSIRSGGVDAFVVSGPEGDQVYTLKGAEQPYRVLVEAMNEGAATLMPDGTILYCNGRFAGMVMTPLEQVINSSVYNFVAPEDLPISKALLDQGMKTNGRGEVYLRKADGSLLPVSLSVTPMQVDGTSVVCAVIADLTEQKRAEEELVETETRFRSLADTAPVLIWMSDSDGQCTYCNRQWLDFTGRPLERELGNGWVERVHPEDQEHFLTTYVSAIARREPFGIEYRLLRTDGHYRWMFNRGVPRYSPEGGFLGHIGSCIDMTELKQAQLESRMRRVELTHLTRVATLGELTASLAHEINQPLAAILSNAQAAQRFLSQGVPDLDEVRKILLDISRDDKRASEVIRSLRELLRREGAQHDPVDVHEMIRDTLRVVRSDLLVRNVTAATELAHDLPPVLGDRIQLQQVLLNLILNGSDAMMNLEPDARRLEIRTQKQDDQRVRVSVRDFGIGFDQNQLARVFEPFYTTKPEGLGMGLSISRSIIETHGGLLWAASNPDRGATFHFELPIERGDVP